MGPTLSSILSSAIVWHFKSPKALRPLLHISPSHNTNNTKLSTIAKETGLLLHRQRCRETSQNATRACHKAVFPQCIKCLPCTSATLQRTMRLQYPARSSYPYQVTRTSTGLEAARMIRYDLDV
ncbi:hypothetical protein K503DRAFT_770279 [Rhizopogon vinicolor AM-OR11-026]|uniref:Uncharacterized protein n=1 Tax=Rhizopogon vinicolor AM-OR11-026 TaxID=1314800 RepID=A0A1B7N1D3_9AGAM|nr:hypothetical protein K503DRAFT_770279 [Rhizopogon vinicolor AM-OR11-026]